MKKLIVIADWAHDSLTCQEVGIAIEGNLKNAGCAKIGFIASSPSTIHTGYLLAQITQVEERYGQPLNAVFFVNTDPRIQTKDAVKDARGAELIVAKLFTGLYVFGPNAGFNFSFIKNKVKELFTYEKIGHGSQFRSRDLYSRVAAHLMDNLTDELDLEEVSSNIIPVFQDHYVGHIDNYGNIKTTIKLSDLKGKHEFGEILNVTMNGLEKKARFVNNLFGAEPGVLVIYPGSSGAKDDPFLEISIWRHFTEDKPTTGLHVFNFPKPGMRVKLT